MHKIKVAHVDGQRLFRAGIQKLLERENDIEFVWSAGNGIDMIKMIQKLGAPNILLMDIDMPQMNGIEATMWLQKNLPNQKIIVVSMVKESDKILNLIKAGIRGYVFMDASPEELLYAMRKVNEGGLYFPDLVVRYLYEKYTNNLQEVHLNAKEIEFIKLSGSELTYKEIANNMGVSTRNVEVLRVNLFNKLGISSRVGLILYGIRKKLFKI